MLADVRQYYNRARVYHLQGGESPGIASGDPPVELHARLIHFRTHLH